MLFYLDELLVERRYVLFVLDRHILYLSDFIVFSYFVATHILLRGALSDGSKYF